MAIINGTSKNDNLIGTLLADKISAGSGNDYVDGGEGDDIINGGSGNDTLYGGLGNDTIDGGSDTDTLYGGDGDDTLKGGSGSASDTLYGEAGNDNLDGGSGDDYLDGGAGNDVIEGGSGSDVLIGDSDTLNFTTGNLVLNGGFENPDIVDHGGAWEVYAGIPDWTTTGGAGPELQDTSLGLITADEGAQYLELDSNNNSAIAQDIATNGTGNFLLEFAYSPREGVATASNGVEVWWNGQLLDTLTGDTEGWTTHSYVVQGAGATTGLEFRAVGTSDGLGGFIDDVSVRGVDAGNDTLSGGSGNDYLYGGAGDDSLIGDSGNDSLFGQSGNDTLFGNSGSDNLDGGDGDDVLTGNSGADSLTGGMGADIFDFTSLSDSAGAQADTIADWETGIDKIDLTGLGFTGIAAGAASGSTLGYAVVGSDTVITADGSDFSIKLTGVHALDNSDFFFA